MSLYFPLPLEKKTEDLFTYIHLYVYIYVCVYKYAYISGVVSNHLKCCVDLLKLLAGGSGNDSV